MKDYICGLRIFAISVALAFSIYGFSAQFIHLFMINTKYKSDYSGWGFLFLIMSHLIVVLPSALVALITFKYKYNPPKIWLGEYGRKIIIIVAGISFLAGALFGWPS